jgi:N-acetylgalactosamine-6-sulfatase
VVPQGQTNTTAVLSAVDLLPTFLEVAGVAMPDGFEPDGESVFAAFKGEAFTRTKPVFWEWRGGDNQDHTWPSLGIQDGPWKLLVNKDTKQIELYNIEKDWAELTDVAAAYPEVVKQLSDKLDAWKETLPTAPSPTCLSKARQKK